MAELLRLVVFLETTVINPLGPESHVVSSGSLDRNELSKSVKFEMNPIRIQKT